MDRYTNRYELMTISAEELLKAAEDESRYNKVLDENAFAFDLSFVTQRERIVKETDVHTENAMMFQIRECLKFRPEYQKPRTQAQERQMLLKHMVFLDFTGVFGENEKKKNQGTEDKQDLLKYLFLHGFTLVFENEEVISYMPFDKSASMSRQSQMAFVDRSLLEASDDLANIERRVTLDIDFTKFKLIPSKYYAYRGLYFTDAHRIPESGAFPLNEETVIVLRKDTPEGGYVNHTLKGKSVITYDRKIFEAEKTKGLVCKAAEDNKDLEIEGFDGEGIISPYYAKWINNGLSEYTGARTQEATSFQIRMPFTKGMLHQVDFHEFMKEFTGREDLQIEDAFGKMRDLSRAQIILTSSMFKCRGWLEKYAAAAGIEDPMMFYFESFHKYSHALYAGNTNLNNPYRNTVKINYQFLNTLDMDAETVRDLVTEQIARSDEILKDPQGEGRRRLLQLPEEDLIYSDGSEAVHMESVRARSRQAWKYALQQNKAFSLDPYIQEKMQSVSFAMLADIAQGKLEVSGALEYLSDDLFALLIYMIRITDLEKEKKDSLTNKLRRATLHKNKFYMADAKEIGIQADKYYTIWRSPHLSRNEQCALKPYLPGADNKHKIAQTQDGDPVNVYVKYFSHLKGVLMVSFASDAALTLGGADYDGDYVKIITDDRFTAAVLHGAYRKEGNCYVRNLPIPYIASPAGLAKTLQSPVISGFAEEARINTAYYETVYRLAQDTFKNRVGLISNEAIESGRQEYFGPPEGRAAWEGSSALATVCTGLEIDAVKTGIHPRLEESTEKIKVQSAGGDFYNRIKYYIGSSDLSRLEFKKTGNELRVSGFANGRKPITVSADEYEGMVHSNIDYLPYYCFEALFRRKELNKELKNRKKAQEEPLFYFENSMIQTEPPEHNKYEELKKMLSTYKQFMQRTGALNWARKNADSSSAVRIAHNILRKRYDYSNDTLPGTEWDIQTALAWTYDELARILPDETQANEARKRYNEYKHAYAIDPAQEWPGIIQKILETDDLCEAAYLLLLEPTEDGYRVLYYLISALCSKYAKDRELDVEAEKIRLAQKEETQCKAYDVALYEEMMKIFLAAETDRKTRRIWMEEIRQLCLKQMRGIFEGDMKEALRYAHLLRPSADKNGSFFWTMFNTDQVAENLYHSEWEAEEHVR